MNKIKEYMAKTLKIWNGRGWGRQKYDTNGRHIYDPTGREYCDHAYVCAHSTAEAIRILNEAAGYRVASSHELNTHWTKGCWGNSMEGITPEVGVWTLQHYGDKPKRIYPIITEGDKNAND